MKVLCVGDLVMINFTGLMRRLPMTNVDIDKDSAPPSGIILDSIEMEDGFSEYEVMLEDGTVGWFSDIHLSSLNS